MRETIIDVLTKRKDLIEDAIIEAIEDMGLGMAIKEGKTGEYVNSKEFLRKLDIKIKTAKQGSRNLFILLDAEMNSA